jgi:hypothetical protein
MTSPPQCDNENTESRPGRIAACLIATISFVRGLPLFVSSRPRSPLGVLCLMAFDTVAVFRDSRRLSSHTLKTLASLLDFGACVNDFFDGNEFSRREYRATRRLLVGTSTCVLMNEYVSRLRDLEKRRPSPGGDARHHRTVQSYRESVVRLSLGMVAATALDNLSIDDGIQATYHDAEIETLYRIVMLCQIIDDVLDFATDIDNDLPTFLTAHTLPREALSLTSEAATRYADGGGLPTSRHLFPFRVALLAISALAKLTIMFGRCRLKMQAIRTPSELVPDQ